MFKSGFLCLVLALAFSTSPLFGESDPSPSPTPTDQPDPTPSPSPTPNKTCVPFSIAQICSAGGTPTTTDDVIKVLGDLYDPACGVELPYKNGQIDFSKLTDLYPNLQSCSVLPLDQNLPKMVSIENPPGSGQLHMVTITSVDPDGDVHYVDQDGDYQSDSEVFNDDLTDFTNGLCLKTCESPTPSPTPPAPAPEPSPSPSPSPTPNPGPSPSPTP